MMLVNIAGGKTNFRDGYAKFFAAKIKEKGNSKLDCIYCGKNTALEVPSYVNPFITQIDKFPNAYSWGNVKSLALCNDCFLIGIAANSRIIFKAQQISNKQDFISMILFFLPSHPYHLLGLKVHLHHHHESTSILLH